VAKNGVNELNCSWLGARPISHRGLHHRSAGVIENSLSACMRSAELGYPIECDLRAADEGIPMVFHDAMLERLTPLSGRVLDYSATELSAVELKRGKGDTIPTFTSLLEHLDGKVPIIVELKGTVGESDQYLHNVLQASKGYCGKLAFMSFEHYLLERMRELKCPYPLGLTAEGGDDVYEVNSQISERLNLDFVSYNIGGLDCKFVKEMKEQGKPLISWTVMTPERQMESFKAGAQITFEGFLPDVTDRPG